MAPTAVAARNGDPSQERAGGTSGRSHDGGFVLVTHAATNVAPLLTPRTANAAISRPLLLLPARTSSTAPRINPAPSVTLRGSGIDLLIQRLATLSVVHQERSDGGSCDPCQRSRRTAHGAVELAVGDDATPFPPIRNRVIAVGGGSPRHCGASPPWTRHYRSATLDRGGPHFRC